MSWSVTASDESVGSVTLAAGTTVLVAALTWSTGTLTYVRWDGKDMTLAVSVTLGSNAAAIFIMNMPEIKTAAITADVSMTYANAISIIGTIGETASIGDTDTNSHASNDFLTVSVASASGDIVIYCGDKTLGANWVGADVTTNYGLSAFENAIGTPTAAGFGDVDDQEIVACAVALGIKPITRSSIIVVA